MLKDLRFAARLAKALCYRQDWQDWQDKMLVFYPVDRVNPVKATDITTQFRTELAVEGFLIRFDNRHMR